MGDEKFYTIQVKGTAYRFKPLPPDDIEMVVTVLSMGASLSQSIKALAKGLEPSLGEDQWDAIVGRMTAKEITVADLVKVFQTLLKRQSKTPAANPADDAE